MTDPKDPTQDGLSPEDIARATELLEAIVADRGLLAAVPQAPRERLLIAAGQVSRPDKLARRVLARARLKHERKQKKQKNQQLLDQTGIRRMRDNPIFQTPRRKALYDKTTPTADGHGKGEPLGEVQGERTCYCCRQPYTLVHGFYDQMCVACGDFNHAKRTPTADLSGRVALVTGARVKIGYQAAIMLLRSGCEVHVATRFPRDAAGRYAAEDDFADWGHRLQIHGIDLRHTPGVEALCAHLLQTLSRLDFIINNACQTVRRPPGFYDHLLTTESAPVEALPPAQAKLLSSSRALAVMDAQMSTKSSAEMTQVELLPEDRERGQHLFPAGQLDQDLQ